MSQIRLLRRVVSWIGGALVPIGLMGGPLGFTQKNLVSDGAVPAVTIDPDLKNPWGLSFSSTSPFWVSDAGAGLSTLYNGSGAKLGLVVTIPPAPGSPVGTLGSPTGTVFSASGFMNDRFLFATEDGLIVGWSGGTQGLVRVDNSVSASYKGLAILNGTIYATNFANGKIDVFDSNYSPVNPPGGFTDPNLPAGYSPFGIQEIGGFIYVTYAKKEQGGNDDEPGPGFGFVDKYDANGVLVQRVVSGDPGNPNNPLNSPWGMALAPQGFGDLSGLLLIGNFGDGKINGYDPMTGAFVGVLKDRFGNPIVNDGLWAIAFGNGAGAGKTNNLYFTAGLNDEEDGLFGSLQAVPEPGSGFLLAAGLGLGVLTHRLRRRA